MAIYKEISSKMIIRKVMRDLKPNHANWIDDAVEWIGEALEHIGAATQLKQKQCVLDVVDHKVLLPSDLYYINQVAINNSVAPNKATELDAITKQVKGLTADISEYNKNVEDAVANSSLSAEDLEKYDTQYKSNVLELRELTSRIVVLEGVYFRNSAALEPLSYGASTFHASMHCEGCSNEMSQHKESYIIDNDYIKTSFRSGKVCISYQAFATDADCYPLVPDDISYKEAMFWYIFKQMLLGGFAKPTNPIDYNFADQKWRYYCTQARNAANYPDIDKYESFMNQLVRLVPDINRHEMFFEELNDRETLYRG